MKSLNLAARFLAVPRGVIRIERAVSDDNCTRIERFDFIDSGKPIVEAFYGWVACLSFRIPC
jgi:hypothetical protein